MKILITGGAGFIGSHIQDAYIDWGHEVAVLDNMCGGQRENLNPKALFFECDIRSPEAARAVSDFKPDVLNLHAAQMDVRKSVEDPKYDCDVNGMGMLNLLEAGRRAGVKKVIFASSGGAVYGEQEVFPADETHPTHPVSPYGITKLLGDNYLAFYRLAYGIDFVSLRYANVYGPRQNPHGEAGVVAIFSTKFLAGEEPMIFGDGLQTRDYVFVKDVVKANVLVLEGNFWGIYNVGTGLETTVVQLHQKLSDILGLKVPARYAPAKPGEQRRSVISSAKMARDFHWRPETPLSLGLKETVAFFSKRSKG